MSICHACARLSYEHGQECAAEVSALLRDTTVQREALSKSSRTFDRAESFLVARNGKRTRIADSCITKVQKDNNVIFIEKKTSRALYRMLHAIKLSLKTHRRSMCDCWVRL